MQSFRPTLLARLLVCLPFAGFLLPFEVRAEYRAFELVISNSTTGQELVVVSSLTPHQYRQYYPTKYEDKVSYRATWMCKGNTSGHKAICPKPPPKESPASGPAT